MVSRWIAEEDKVRRRPIHPVQWGRSNCLGLIALFLLQVSPALSQERSDSVLLRRAAVSIADSVSLRREARDAQQAFERTRVRHLPLTWTSGGWDCDEIVGRMCWRHDDEDDDWTPAPEAEQIRIARDTLLVRLDHIGDLIRGDDWVLGQRVWYRGEAGRWSEALALAVACPGGHEAWCSALEGLALHHFGEYVAAEVAFAKAEPALAERRTSAEALDLLLDGDARGWLREERAASEEGGAGENIAREDLIWSLADPLFGVPGNDRLTDHQARRTLDLIRRGARNPYGLPWGDDTAELQIRYGWEAGWERDQSRSSTSTTARVVGRHASRSRRFVPSGDVLMSPALADTAELAPLRRRPRSTYSPAYARDIVAAQGQVLTVLRGEDGFTIWAILDEARSDSTMGVGGARDRDPPTGAGTRDESSVTSVPSRSPGGFALDLSTLELRSADSVAPGVFGLEAPYGGHVLSVEEWSDDDEPTVRRLRRGVYTERLPPDVIALSDLLLLEDGPLPMGLDEAAARLLRRPPVPGDTVVVAWTVHGLGFDGADLEYSISTDEQRGGILRRIGRWLRISDEEASVSTRWSEPAPRDPGPLFRSVRLVLPEWEGGTHSLTLSLSAGGRAAAIARSALRLQAQPPR